MHLAAVQRNRAESAKVFVRLVNPPFAAFVRGTKIMLGAGLGVKKRPPATPAGAMRHEKRRITSR
jgi:hypothetical protein